jgi:DNA polymerase III alpha subunit (gram-positive type)
VNKFIVRYLAFDLESGGIPDGCSVLTAFFQVLDENMQEIDSLHLHVKPNDGVYHCTAEAMDINKINLIEHDKTAITYSDAGQKLRNFLVKNSDNGKVKLIPMGKNINGDINWVNESMLGKKTWNMYVSYRIWEVTTLALACQSRGKMPHDMSISLGSLVEYFGIMIPGDLHNERYDTLATVRVSEALLDLLCEQD